jgi:hypothetical protein
VFCRNEDVRATLQTLSAQRATETENSERPGEAATQKTEQREESETQAESLKDFLSGISTYSKTCRLKKAGAKADRVISSLVLINALIHQPAE